MWIGDDETSALARKWGKGRIVKKAGNVSSKLVFGAAASMLVLAAASARAEATSEAVATAGSGAAAPAAADAPAAKPETQTVQEVVVTGFRSSLAKAVSIKRNENAAADT